MGWFIDKNRPICPQIEEQLCAKIARGEFKAGERLLSVRDIALAAGVNPNTVQKALEKLKNDEIIYSIGGSGWYVGEDNKHAKKVLGELIKRKTDAYFEELMLLGCGEDEIKDLVKEWNK